VFQKWPDKLKTSDYVGSTGKPCAPSDLGLKKLEQCIAAHGTPQRVAMRCRIVAAAAGESDVAITQPLSVNRNTVILWRKRFAGEGLDCLWEIAPGRGRKPVDGIEKIAAIVDATLQTIPTGMTYWTCQTIVQNQGSGGIPWLLRATFAMAIKVHPAFKELNFRGAQTLSEKTS
jgi:transposase